MHRPLLGMVGWRIVVMIYLAIITYFTVVAAELLKEIAGHLEKISTWIG